VNTEQQQIYHLEQVFKFYIYYPAAGTDLAAWIGPNNKDHLVQKLEKLYQKQFPLLRAAATQALLQQKGIVTPNIQPQLSFKAALFTPWGAHFPTDNSVNSACWRGFWLAWAVFLQQNWKEHQFFIPSKQNWGTTPTQQTTWYSLSELLPVATSWLARKKAPLCWVKTPAGTFLELFLLWW
jgi:hypothetical protein